MLECPRNNLRVVLDLFGKELLSLNRSSTLNIKLFIKEGSKIKGKIAQIDERMPLNYRTRVKVSRAYSKLTQFLVALIFENFRKMLIFEPCLFRIYKMYLIFWPISMYSWHFYGSNIPLKYTVMLWYQKFYLRNKFSIF